MSEERITIDVESTGKSYELITEKQTLSGAVTGAESKGGALAQFETAAELSNFWSDFNGAELAAMLSQFPTPSCGGGSAYVWLGGNDIASEGTWVWNKDLGEGVTISTDNPAWGSGTKGTEPDLSLIHI